MSCVSELIGAVDDVYTWGLQMMTASDERFFSEGYGDIERSRRLRGEFLADWSGTGGLEWQEKFSNLNLEWDSKPEVVGSPNARVYNATFESPIAEYVPHEVATGHVRLLLPTGRIEGILLQTAATNEEDYASREVLAKRLCDDHGLASLIMTVPYYGVRRAVGQTSSKLLSVADYQLQNLGVVIEGVALLRWLQGAYPNVPLGVAGMSWGGAMASCIAVLCRMPVACIPYVGMTSPACMVTGIIKWQLDWERLADEQGGSLEQTRCALEDEFRGITLRTLVEKAPKPLEQTIASMVQVSASSDKYVPAWEGEELYAALAPVCAFHDIRWISGGHVSAFLRAETEFVSAIVTAFEHTRAVQTCREVRPHEATQGCFCCL